MSRVEDGVVMTRVEYQLQRRFEGAWMDDGDPYAQAADAGERLDEQRRAWPDEFRVVRVKTKVMDW